MNGIQKCMLNVVKVRVQFLCYQHSCVRDSIHVNGVLKWTLDTLSFMLCNTKLSYIIIHKFIGEKSNINTLPIIYIACNEKHKLNKNNVQKNMKTIVQVHLQINTERTKNMFHVSWKEWRANSPFKDMKKILWKWSTVQIIGNATNQPELHA